MAQIPFVGPSYNLDSRPSGVQRTINLIPVPEEPGNERTSWVFKDVPGLTVFNRGATDPLISYVVALYPFDGDLVDYVGSRDLTMVSGAYNTNNPFGTGVRTLTGNSSLDSASGTFASLTIAAAQEAFTYEFWFRRQTNGSYLGAPVQDTGGAFSFAAANAGNTTATFASSLWSSVTQAATINDGGWHFIAITRDAGVAGNNFIWIDGVQWGTATGSNAFTTTNLTVFRRSAGTASNDANISNLRISRGINRYVGPGPYPKPTAPFPKI
jgi:hypothetical protein